VPNRDPVKSVAVTDPVTPKLPVICAHPVYGKEDAYPSK